MWIDMDHPFDLGTNQQEVNCVWMWMRINLAIDCVIHRTQHETFNCISQCRENKKNNTRICSSFMYDLVSHLILWQLELITNAPTRAMRVHATILLVHIVRKISAFMLVNQKAAEANRLMFFCLSFYCLMRAHYDRTVNNIHQQNENRFFIILNRLRIFQWVSRRCHQLFPQTKFLFLSTVFFWFPNHTLEHWSKEREAFFSPVTE